MGMLVGMGNGGMGEGGVMEGWGVNRRVLLVFALSLLLERVFRGERGGMAIHM